MTKVPSINDLGKNKLLQFMVSKCLVNGDLASGVWLEHGPVNM